MNFFHSSRNFIHIGEFFHGVSLSNLLDMSREFFKYQESLESFSHALKPSRTRETLSKERMFSYMFNM